MTALALAITLTVVSVLGLLLNSYILFIVIASKQAQTANNLLLLHLGVVDLLLGLTFLIFSAPDLLKGWNITLVTGATCNLHGFLFTLLHPVALWTVCGLNCDRYYAITAPLHYGTFVNVRKVVIGLSTAWFVSLTLCVPPLFKIAPYKHNPGLAGCAPDFAQDTGALWYSVTYTTVCWLLPTLLILGCNLRILTIARYHRHRIASAIFEVTISAQVTITHQRNPFFIPAGSMFRGRRAISTVLQLVLSFLLLYCPYYTAILWDSSSSKIIPTWRVHPFIFTIASALLTCSPPINGLLYGVKSKVLRTTFKNFWRKQMTKNEMNQEIQARTPSACGSRRPSVTPATFPRPLSAQLPRRLSESNDSFRPRIQRIASESSWQPNSFGTESMRRSTSCRDTANNSLQPPPVATIDIPSFRMFRVAVSRSKHSSNPNLSATNLFLQRVFGHQQQHNKKAAAIQTVLATTPRSPRILITRAFSEESEPSPTLSQRKESMTKSYSSSTTLLDRKWKKLRYQDSDDNRGSENSVRTESESLVMTTPKKATGEMTQLTDDGDTSSSTSDEEHSSGNIYLPFEEASDTPVKSTKMPTTVSTPHFLFLIDGMKEDDTKSCDGRVEGLWMKQGQGRSLKFRNHFVRPDMAVEPDVAVVLNELPVGVVERKRSSASSWPCRKKKRGNVNLISKSENYLCSRKMYQL